MTIYEVFKLLGGVGLFLYGMHVMSAGLSNAAGDKMREILEKVTSNRFMAVIMGVVVTVLIQSSSATDMMVIGFVNSGLMGLGQAIAVIMGANIGTTVTAQITAFNLTDYTPLILFIGAVLYMFVKKKIVKHIGEIILGFGMLFVGIWIIKMAIQPLSQSPTFAEALKALDHPVPAILFGLAFTALLQSSSSSVVIFQTFAMQGLLSYHTAVYLVIGAAVGSVAPNLLAGMTANRDGKRTALLNLIFNLFRAALIMILITLIPGITDLIQKLSPGGVGRQIANTHTCFAIIAVVCGYPLMDLFVRLAKVILPDLPEEKELAGERQLKYMLNMDSILPSLAVRQGMLETIRLGEMARTNLDASLQYFFGRDEKLLRRVESREGTIDYLTKEISAELVELRSRRLSEREVYRVAKLTLMVSNFERIGDHAENITEYVEKLESTSSSISEIGSKSLKELAEKTLAAIDTCLDILRTEDLSKLAVLDAQEDDVDAFERQIIMEHANRLLDNQCAPMAGIVYTDLCTALERCADHAVNIAYGLVYKK